MLGFSNSSFFEHPSVLVIAGVRLWGIICFHLNMWFSGFDSVFSVSKLTNDKCVSGATLWLIKMCSDEHDLTQSECL